MFWSLLTNLLAAEIYSWLPTISVWLLRYYASKISDPQISERLLEEWHADLESISGNFSKLVFVLPLILTVWHVEQLHYERKVLFRAGAVLMLFICLRAFGNLSLALGMKHLARTVSISPVFYMRAMLHPFVALGITMLFLALLTRMVLLSLADLNYVLLVTPVGYVLAAFLGKVSLHETVTLSQWIGTGLIFLGSALVGSTVHSRMKEVEVSK
jgi:hypothetical protein